MLFALMLFGNSQNYRYLSFFQSNEKKNLTFCVYVLPVLVSNFSCIQTAQVLLVQNKVDSLKSFEK